MSVWCGVVQLEIRLGKTKWTFVTGLGKDGSRGALGGSHHEADQSRNLFKSPA